MSEKQIVQTPSLFAVDDSFEDARFMKVRVASMHSGVNLNGSRFSKDTIKKAKGTFANIPILANTVVVTDEDGNQHLDYGSHDMHIEDDAFHDGEQRIIYDEKVVGIVPEQNNFELVHDDETGNDYAMVDALIFRDYGNYVADILETRGGTTAVSAEIACEKVSYDAKEKCLDVGEMTMCAITLLGEDVKPGMKNAHATTFSISENDVQSQMMIIMQELKDALVNYTNAVKQNNHRKEDMETVEDEKILNEEVTEEVVEETTEELAENETTEETPDVVEEEMAEEAPAEEEEVEEEKTDFIQMTANVNGEVKTFEVSLRDKMNALFNLVNETYGESDNAFYDVDVYEDSKTVVFHDYWMDKHYKQSYAVKKDVYSLKGDRVQVYTQYLTQDEIDTLDNMKANYAEITEKLAKYEAEPEKMEILNSNDYAQLSEIDDFKSLKEQNNHFDLSVEEVRAKADEMLLAYAKNNIIEFATVAEENKPVTRKAFNVEKEKPSKKNVGRYKGTFSKKD